MESETTKFKANENAVNALQFNHPDNREAQILQHEHVESAKKVTELISKTR